MPRLLLIFTLLLGAQPVFSADGGKTLSWQECQRMALQQNPDLAGYRYALESARSSYKASRNQDLPYPGLTATHSYTRSGGQHSGPGDTFAASLSASETLFSVSALADLKVQLKAQEKAELSARQSSSDTRVTLLKAFISLLYAQDNIAMTESIAKIRAGNSETIKLQYAGGTQSLGNMMKSLALAEQAKANVAQAGRDLVSAQRALAAALGMDTFQTLVASGTLSVPALVRDTNVDGIAPLLPNVLVAKKSVESYEMLLKQAGASLYPKLSASQSLSWSDGVELPGNRSWSLGMALSWPLFANGPTYVKHNTDAARANLRKAQETYRSTLLTAKSDLQGALATFETAVDTVRTSKLLMDSAKQRYDESEIQYLAGLITFQDWQTISSEFVSAEEDYLSSLKSVNTARAQVDGLLGVPLGD